MDLSNDSNDASEVLVLVLQQSCDVGRSEGSFSFVVFMCFEKSFNTEII